jgi:hypothetical protein
MFFDLRAAVKDTHDENKKSSIDSLISLIDKITDGVFVEACRDPKNNLYRYIGNKVEE